jgi:hypothetical protein
MLWQGQPLQKIIEPNFHFGQCKGRGPSRVFAGPSGRYHLVSTFGIARKMNLMIYVFSSCLLNSKIKKCKI